MRIQRLEPTVVNQIAAGEVIERPASVVKELMENAIDAGATQITVTLKDSGKQSIVVQDNGGGIHPDDLPLTVVSHATSKITTLSDLDTVNSLGFRGEALASIASVSRFSIISKHPEHDTAYRLDRQHNELVQSETNHPPGTTVSVSGLFYNTPARRKFLRSNKVELNHIESTVKRLLLGSPAIGVEFVHNDKRLFSVPGAGQSATKRIEKIIGKNFMACAHKVVTAATGLRLEGYVSDATFFRSQNDCQYVFLNHRFIKDKLIQHAIISAYQDILYQGRYPGYLLYVSIDPKEFDINVHPTKQEIRLYQPRLIHDFILNSVKNALTDAENAPAKIDKTITPTPIQVQEPVTHYTDAPISAKADEALNFRWIGKCFGQVWLLANADDLVIVNGLKLKQTLTETLLMAAYDDKSIRSKPLLLPMSLSIESNLYDPLLHCLPDLNAFGFDIDLLVDSVVMRKIPEQLAGLNPESALTALVAFCQSHKPPWKTSVRQAFVQAMSQQLSCDISAAEQRGLLAQFSALTDKEQRRLAKFIPSAEIQHAL